MPTTKNKLNKCTELGKIALLMKTARTYRGMSQRDLGDKIGKSQNFVFSLESGEKDIGILILNKIAKALDVPLSLFLDVLE